MSQYNAPLILDLKRRIEEDFTSSNWEEAGLLTDSSHIISGHPRLLRSLSFGDQDYGGNIISVLRAMSDHNPDALNTLKGYLDQWYPDQNITYISAKPSEKKISFAPNVFSIPDGEVEGDLITVMMPFAGFDGVYQSIKSACTNAGYRCLRADDIWDNSSIIQDIFSLIYRAKIVIVDFSGKNPNVMYETGIAHTLGKIVVPLAQIIQDIPSDMVHHRALIYLKNGEGLTKLETDLEKKLRTIS
ncbi:MULTISPECIES: hypothetical protein [unclassified Pseudomonas]|uniref:hypothetical protein n=1 Tax=unclassified Pseudomonas TaxID=196821 RepID=UPI000C2FBB17|nr:MULTISPECIES: hypothetical protein [unclassified Pseudomonas]MCU1740015.1 hypothetical protein [Pseudomonas sp. 20S_6.2_Bac1]